MSKEMNSNLKMKTKFLWHSSGIYCLTFDRTGDFIFTGGDDGIVKIYSVISDQLIHTLSDGSEVEFKNEIEIICKTIDDNEIKDLEKKMEKYAIYDIGVNYENTLLSAGKHTGLILVWNLQTYELVAKLDRHMTPVCSLEFSPVTLENNDKYLISMSKDDGFMFFWRYSPNTNVFQTEPAFKRMKYDNNRAHNALSAHSSGGLLIGLIHSFVKSSSKPKSKKIQSNVDADISQCAIRIFSLSDDSGPAEVWNSTHIKSHDTCGYSLKFSNNSFRFASGCDQDMNASIWYFDETNRKWDQILIDITKYDPNKVFKDKGKEKDYFEELYVEELCWTCDDTHVITCLSDDTIKVWHSKSGELVKHFNGVHTSKIMIVQSHPKSDNIFMSGGYDGKIFIYDIINGSIIRELGCVLRVNNFNNLNGSEIELNPMLHEFDFSPNGLNMAVTDSWGNLSVFRADDPKDSIDLLAKELERIHGESDEENMDEEPLKRLKQSDEQFLNSVKSKFDSENQLLHPQLLKQKDSNKIIEIKKPIESKNKLLNVSSIKTTATNNSNSIGKVATISPDLKKKPLKPLLTKSNKNVGLKESDTKHELKSETISDKKIDNNIETKINGNEKNDMNLERGRVENEINRSYESPDNGVNLNSGKTSVDMKGKGLKSVLRSIMTSILENKLFEVFHTIDPVEYPTYRRETPNADLSLCSIHESLCYGRKGLAGFRNDMKLLIENLSNFFETRDENILLKVIELEKFYEKQMDDTFGIAWKPKSNNCDDSKTESLNESQESQQIEQNNNKTNNCDESKTESLNESKESQKVGHNNKKTNKRKRLSKAAFNKKQKLISKQSKDNGIVPKRDNESVAEISSGDVMNGENESIPLPQTRVFDALELESEVPDVVQTLEISEEDDNEILTLEIENDLQCVDAVESGSKINAEIETTKYEIENHSTHFDSTPYFCIFCDKIFQLKSDAISHYSMHLCPLKCKKCKQEFPSYDDFLAHNDSHKRDVEWCQHYKETNVWINNFLLYQQTDAIIGQNYEECVVCNRVKRFRKQSEKVNYDETLIEHLKRHLRYNSLYKCLFCFLNEDQDDEETVYFYNSEEARNHLKSEHCMKQTDDPLVYFNSNIPKLEEIIRQYS